MFVCSVGNFVDIFFLGVALGFLGTIGGICGYAYYLKRKKNDPAT